MRASPESGLPNSFWKLLFLAAFLALFCLLPVIAQKAQGNDASAPKYDPHTETTMKGPGKEAVLVNTSPGCAQMPTTVPAALQSAPTGL